MLNREEIKGIRGRLPKAFYYDESPETYQLIEQDIPALLSHVEALEERLRKAAQSMNQIRNIAHSLDHSTIEGIANEALAELSPSQHE